MNLRKTVEERILFIFLTYDKELISDTSTVNSFDIIRKHSLSWEDFSEKLHQDIFKAILNQMHDGMKRMDITTLVDYRPKEYKAFEPQRDQFYSIIVNLKNTSFATFSELDGLIYRLKENVMSDYWLNTGQRIMSTSFSTINVIEFGDAIMQTYNQLYSRMTSGIIESENSIGDMTNSLLQKMDNASKGIIGGVPIPVMSIHNNMHGFNPPDLIILAARPSMGKTQTGLGFANFAAQAGYPTVFVSIEMSKLQLTNKIVAQKTGISTERIKLGTISPEEFATVVQEYKNIENSNLNILSGKFRNLELLKQKCKELHKIGKLKILFIDYLQLIRTSHKTGTRDLEIGYITGELKALALELNIPIVVLCQLSRGADGRQPRLTDLRESGNIEQDADIVSFVHRGAFYQPNYKDLPYHEQWKAEYVTLKNRSGKLFTVDYFIDVERELLLDVQ